MATAAPLEETEVYIGFLPDLHDGEETLIRDTMIKHIKEYKGEPIPAHESFKENWLIIEAELRNIMDAGLIPADCIGSTGLDNMSYKNYNMCADTLQGLLYEGELFKALGNLRGFRRLFSESKDSVLRHAFRGDPLEILRNIYYGGHGVLPEDRMVFADPFHYTIIGKAEQDDED